jgi:hypothetical protein
MMDRQTFTFINPQQAYQAILNVVWPLVKAATIAGERISLTIAPQTRSQEQSAKFHAICGDLAKSKFPWASKPRTAEAWKVLLISGHSVATEQGAEMVPGLEGEFCNIRESSASMSVSRMSSLVEYALAFCAVNGVRLSAPEHETEPA